MNPIRKENCNCHVIAQETRQDVSEVKEGAILYAWVDGELYSFVRVH